MSHTCSTALIRCIDFRLTQAINLWMEKKGIMDDCDIISVAGVCKALAEDKSSDSSKFILNQIELSSCLHEIQKLYIIHHTDCGAYGGHESFADITEEKSKHFDDMRNAQKTISEMLPGLDIVLVLANITDDGTIQISEIEMAKM